MKLPAARQRTRVASYALLSIALLVVATYAGWLTLRLRVEQRDEAVDRAREELSALSQVWERSVLERSAGWLSGLAQSPDPGRRDRAARATTDALQGLYLWSTGPGAPALRYPEPAPPEPPPSPKATALRRALDRAQELLLADQPSRAWEALSLPELPLYTPLADARAGVYATRDLVSRRVLASAALAAMGDRHRQLQLLARTNAELTQLPAGLLSSAMPWAVTPLSRDLELVGAPADITANTLALEGAARRLEGSRAVEALLPALTALAAEDRHQATLPTPTPAGEDDAISPRDLLIEDAASPRQGLVLLYALNPQGDLGLAAQWSEAALHDELLSALPTDSLLGAPVILDQEGHILAGEESCGAPGDPDAVWVRVPLSALLAHRRLGLCATAERPAPTADLASTTAAMAPIALALLLGGGALLARVSADRRQRELYERQRAFITRVTHELKTPLAGIRIMAETLEIGAFRDAAQREALALRIQDEVDRLSTRIDEVLRVARTDELDGAEPVDLSALLAELVELWRPRFETVGARIEADLGPLPPLLADRALLRDALNNLLDNALKYLREDRPGLLRVTAREDGRWLVVEVADNGLGVPAAQRRAIFQPFVRVEGPGRGKAGGHGLGLSFVAETARAHGGTVECRDGLDGGARFVLRFRRSSWKKGGSRASSSSKTTTRSP